MCFLANILTSENFKKSKFYNVTPDISKLIPGVTTLIVGWDRVKELYPDASILNWKINENTYWTYGKRVKREKYEKDIASFEKLVINNVYKNTEYVFFNVLITTKEEKKEFFLFLQDDSQKFLLISNNMFYIYSVNSKKTYGISLSDIDYEGGDRKIFLEKILRNKNNILVKERDYITFDVKDLIANKKYIIPYLASIDW